MKPPASFRILLMSMVALFTALGCFFTTDLLGVAPLSDTDATRTQIAQENQQTLTAFNATITARAIQVTQTHSANSTEIPISTPSASTDISPELIAKAFIVALFDADIAGIQATLCQSALADLSEEALQSLADAIASLDTVGGELDLLGLTYVYDAPTQSVFVRGSVQIIVDGQPVDSGLNMADFFPIGIPVIEEDGRWKVCPVTS